VLLQLGFMACSAQNTSGMMAKLFDAGAGDTGVLGGSDAQAQTMPCTQWETKLGMQVAMTGAAVTQEAGWEPFSSLGTYVVLRRCIAR
jgi:hypothetical protein